MMPRRLKELTAMAMIGEGVLALLYPEGHVRLWDFDAPVYHEVVEAFAQRPSLTRLVGALEAGAGLWWAARQYTR